MARRKSFAPHDAYDLLLDMFWREGIGAMSVKGMSDHLGLPRSSFYNAFGSREALLKNLIIYYELQSPQMALVLAYPPIDVKLLFTMLLQEMCTQYVHDLERKGCLLTNLSVELRENEPALRELLQQINQDRITRLAEICRWGVNAKDLPRATDCARLGRQLFALIEQLNLMARSLPEIEELEVLATRQLAQLGLLADGPAPAQ
ncbi:TetR/AcrR family transcriptional regulator [Maritalea myrionectae]|uniref:TetR/AcrR family transcriptional regulator n=1 Tax=Maritalea myrionectae TaxID=454601 RepID=UPI00041B6018|nr:TetR/AcrR family transcriptional regulator [Maritalea myrionectae]